AARHASHHELGPTRYTSGKPETPTKPTPCLTPWLRPTPQPTPTQRASSATEAASSALACRACRSPSKTRRETTLLAGQRQQRELELPKEDASTLTPPGEERLVDP